MERAQINADTLTWARQVSGLTVEELASAASIPPERLLQLEEGTSAPTFKQLVKLAKKLDRTPAFFFMPAPESPDMPATIDFRQSPELDGLDASTTKALRRAERYRDIMLEYGDAEPVALAKPFRRPGVQRAAEEMRSLLGINHSFTPPGPSKEAGFKVWRHMVESHGIIVFQTSDVERGVFRGLSVYHEVLPIVVLNGKDFPAGKSFTLFHEISHLINRANGLCMLEEESAEEALANSFAANFLMPETAVRNLMPTTEDDAIGEVASRFKVSRIAAAIRLKELGVLGEDVVQAEKVASDAAWKTERDKLRSRESGPAHWKVRYRDLGPTYVGTVARALKEDRISLLDASYFLDARIPVVDQLVHHYEQSEQLQS